MSPSKRKGACTGKAYVRCRTCKNAYLTKREGNPTISQCKVIINKYTRKGMKEVADAERYCEKYIPGNPELHLI